jgi:MFS superfamily sulfate permease-like transporter
MFGMFDMITTPDFSALSQAKAWWWVFLFFAIGSLESLLSAKAIDMIDPWKRKTSMDRDLTAVGVANLCSAFVGGLPMISEIVRSKANIDNGARTRFADMWHGIFLLACVALLPTMLHRIPLAALAAMLVYTGFRLAHPSEFVHAWHIGREQLVIFTATIIGVLATDLLVGIGIGIGVKLLIHIFNGVPLRSIFKPYLDITDVDDGTCKISAKQSAVFTNWIPFRREIEYLGLVQRKNVIVDLSETKLVDHSVMDKLSEMQRDFEQENLRLEIFGLDAHQQLSDHQLSARKRARLRRITVVADGPLEDMLVDKFISLGATGYNAIACRGIGQHELENGRRHEDSKVRIEAIVLPGVGERLLTYLRREVLPVEHLTVCIEQVDVLRRDHFEASRASFSVAESARRDAELTAVS